MNDQERRQWIDNDQYLYTLVCQSQLSVREFIKQNRAYLDGYIEQAIKGKSRDAALPNPFA